MINAQHLGGFKPAIRAEPGILIHFFCLGLNSSNQKHRLLVLFLNVHHHHLIKTIAVCKPPHGYAYQKDGIDWLALESTLYQHLCLFRR
jgi:hypothetical protein